MNASTSVGATFAAGWYLTVTVGAGSSYSFRCNVFGTCYHDPGGRVTSAPLGIDCAVGPSQSKTCTANFAPDTSVVLTITPFDSHATWGGDCVGVTTGTCTLSMKSSKTVTAYFD
jgi:hypothetical protein